MNFKTILKPLAWITLTLALSAYLERLAQVEDTPLKAEVKTLARMAPSEN